MVTKKVVFAALSGFLLAAAALEATGGARIAITVVDEKGAPVEGAAVTVTTPGVGSFRLSLKTDPKGRAQAILIRTDWSYLLRAEKGGASAKPLLVKLSSEESRSVSLSVNIPAATPASAETKPTPPSDDVEAQYAKGMDLYNAGDYRGAGAMFAQVMQVRRDMAKAYFQLAMCEYQLKRYAESRATFQRYLEMAPQGDQAAAARKMLQSIPEK